MTLSDVRDYIKLNLPNTKVYIGRLGSDEENSIALYARETNVNNLAIGGKANTSCGVRGIKILVHGSTNAAETESFANEVFDMFYSPLDAKEWWSNVKSDAPIGVGADKNNIYEYVINADIWYRKE